jgi:hypothetical protein
MLEVLLKWQKWDRKLDKEQMPSMLPAIQLLQSEKALLLVALL